LLDLAARAEALIDFAEEEDVGGDRHAIASLQAGARALADDIGAVLANPPVERLRDGVRVVLAGAPNAGKSSLLNALADRDAAIVSPIAGTTRDRIEVAVVRDGIAYVITDTAGLVDGTDDPIEEIGVARARDSMATADILLLLDDMAVPDGPYVIPLHPRADQPGRQGGAAGRLSISAHTGEGLASLWRAIADAARDLLPRLDQLVLNQRQRDHVRQAREAIAAAGNEHDLVLVAEHLRFARAALDRVTGLSDTESMLDSLFSRFCIGK